MAASSAYRPLLPLSLLVAASTIAPAQAVPPRSTAPAGATAAWTLKMKGPIRWQQVTPAGALLVSTDAGALGARCRPRRGHLGETGARRVPGRQHPHDRGLAPHGSGGPGVVARVRSGDRHGRLRFAPPRPDAGRHPPSAAAERHVSRSRAA